jgi:hypothetical protein
MQHTGKVFGCNTRAQIDPRYGVTRAIHVRHLFVGTCAFRMELRLRCSIRRIAG